MVSAEGPNAQIDESQIAAIWIKQGREVRASMKAGKFPCLSRKARSAAAKGCDVDEEGNQLVWTGDIPAQQFQTAVLDRLDALSNQVSTHLAWKTPICPPVPTQLEGDFRTISFRSDETSPYGKSRLRKRLRYRSVSGIGLGELVDYWKDFTFEAGPVVVGHVGGPWGSPQVWAASEDEAKRVLRHAAGEAGIDPDQVGEWRVGSSDSSRYGVSGTMRVDTTGGYFWITARDGASERPIVAKTPHL